MKTQVAQRPKRKLKTRQSWLFPQARHLSPNERRALKAYQNSLLEHLPGQIEHIVLYGSKARGDSDPDSDIDLLVIVNGGKPQPEQLYDDDLDLFTKYRADVSPHWMQVQETRRWTPFLDRVWRDGIELWRRRGAVPWAHLRKEGDVVTRDEHVEARMAMARDRLKLARTIVKDGFYRDVISNAYYAMFYASKSLLLELGEDPHKHKGVVNMFGERIAHVGLSDPKYGKTLARYKVLREKADYKDEYVATKEDAQEAIRVAEDFVAEAKNILQRIRERAKNQKS